MTQEEKLKEAKRLYKTANADQKYVLERLFPELAESEDEVIRKAILEHIRYCTESIPDRDKFVAWIEKQGEHKKFLDSIQVGDKVTRNEDGVLINLSQLNRVAKKDEKQGGQKLTEVEHRFKVGDFVVNKNGLIRQIIDLKDDVYFCLREECWDDETHPWHGTVEYVDTHWHKWTLEDAKDGDVLATLDYILIFKEFLKDDGGISYCHYDFGAGNPQFIWSEDGNWYFGKEAIIHPATKEQRDILFAKMHEAGYEWDAKKKELRKIEQKPVWSERYIADVFEKVGLAKIVMEQGNDNLTNALQSAMIELGKFMPQQKPWSEEDEEIHRRCICAMRASACGFPEEEKFVEQVDNWLKSLKDRVGCEANCTTTWKPSGEQMAYLAAAIEESNENAILKSLYQDLMKLRKE